MFSGDPRGAEPSQQVHLAFAKILIFLSFYNSKRGNILKSQLELLFSSLNSNVEKIELFIALSKSSTPAMLSHCLGAPVGFMVFVEVAAGGWSYAVWIGPLKGGLKALPPKLERIPLPKLDRSPPAHCTGICLWAATLTVGLR